MHHLLLPILQGWKRIRGQTGLYPDVKVENTAVALNPPNLQIISGNTHQFLHSHSEVKLYVHPMTRSQHTNN